MLHPIEVVGPVMLHDEPSQKPGYVRLALKRGSETVIGFDVSVDTLAHIVREHRKNK